MKNTLIIITAILILNSCKDNGTQPPVNNYKHPRDMTWTADTLNTDDPNQLQIIPQNLLAFSPNDAWLCCWADGPLGQMWHYDGNEWKVNNILKDVTGKPADIVGFSSRYFWTGGYIGDYVFIAQYNGNNWIDIFPGFYTVDQDEWLKGDILDMSTDEDRNVWACGRNGLVMKYDNNTWAVDTINVGYKKNHPDAEYLLRSITYYNNQVHVLGGIYHSSLQRYINYHFKGYMNNWELLDSMIIDSPSSIIKWGYLGLYETTNKLFSYGSLGIWEYQNSNWAKIYDYNGEIYEIYGQSNQYLLAVSAFRTVLFYGGNNWERIDELLNVDDPHFSFRNVWTNGNEIIIAGDGFINGVQKTIVWHGK
ncbi:MAG: hypothetical protein AB1521_10800 [Bacteroidota bacterium]